MKARILWIIILATLCAACDGSNGGGEPVTNATVQVPGLMATGRMAPAVTLASGDVLVVGGLGSTASVALASGELYHPETGTFTQVANQLPLSVYNHSLAALSDGGALVVGGTHENGVPLSQAQIYDPASNSFQATAGPMNDPRSGCTATTLPDGTVLIAGGLDSSESHMTDTAEIYDPSSGTFSYTKGKMVGARAFHVAVLLADGKVLLAGGLNGTQALASAEIYNPASGTFSATAEPLNSPRYESVAVLLGDGRVLIAGGQDVPAPLDTAELYDPGTSTFNLTANSMSTGRNHPSATPLPDGNAIVCAGSSTFPKQTPDASCDLFDTATNTFSPTGSLHIARTHAAAVVLSDGSPLILGGIDDQGSNAGNYEPSGEIYDPAAGTFTVTGGMNALRVAYGSALLPDGRVLLAGGGSLVEAHDTAEVFDPETRHFVPTANNLRSVFSPCQAVTLNNGKVLIADGDKDEPADLFDPETMRFSPTPGAMVASPFCATATLLDDGTVLIAGGVDDNENAVATAQFYDPESGTFTATGAMTSPRLNHTATLLLNGEVLIAGGSGTSGVLDSAEIYDPKTMSFTALPNTMTSVRVGATANRLPGGRVLIAGGATPTASGVDTAELFDPETGTFTATAGKMNSTRSFHSAVTLPAGTVMLAGGSIDDPDADPTDTVDFYHPSTDQFHAGVPMVWSRVYFTATLLHSNKVLIPGGLTLGSGIGPAALETAEIYTP